MNAKDSPLYITEKFIATFNWEKSRGHSYQIARHNATLVGWLFLPSGKSTRSGNLVLAWILAFYAIKTASLSPLGPLATSNSALRTGAAPQASSWWTWAPAAHSLPVPSSDSTQPIVF